MTSDVIVKYFYLITARVFILNFEPGKIDIYMESNLSWLVHEYLFQSKNKATY